jgi:hypothetical protein
MNSRTIALAASLTAASLVAEACDGPASTDLGCQGLPVAPAGQRVDLGRPVFSNPTAVDNPLFPISSLNRVILLGSVDGVPLRVETTLMSGTRSLQSHGQVVPTLESQYVAWLGRRIHEVALDWYAQDDRGAVWYFGEDVFNYEDGVIADTEGTWRAGSDGDAAMIMAASPQVGNVWRPENVCGLVFEEVTVRTIGLTVNGPSGPTAGAIEVEELHLDGGREAKIFAPGYGEFSTGVGADLEAVALAVPTDALVAPVPAELTAMSADADTVFAAARLGDWAAASAAANRVAAAWAAYGAGSVPPMLRTQGDAAVAALSAAVQANSAPQSRRAAIEVDQVSLDLQLRYRPRAEIDLSQLALWSRQLIVDAEAGDLGAVTGDAATLDWIRARLVADVGPDADLQLRAVKRAIGSRDLGAVSAAGSRLVNALARERRPASR